MLKIDKLPAEPGAEVVFDKVMMVKTDGDAAKIGAPYLENASVKAEVLEQGKHKLLSSSINAKRTISAKSRKHRQKYTRKYAYYLDCRIVW